MVQCVVLCCSVLEEVRYSNVPLSIWMCVALCRSLLQCGAVRCSVLQCVEGGTVLLMPSLVSCSVLQCFVVCCRLLQRVEEGVVLLCLFRYLALCCSVEQCFAVHCTLMQDVAK